MALQNTRGELLGKASASGSSTFVSNSVAFSSLVADIAPAAPTPRPIATSVMPSRTVRRSTPFWLSPQRQADGDLAASL